MKNQGFLKGFMISAILLFVTSFLSYGPIDVTEITGNKALKVTARTDKNIYEVNEPISFYVKVNKKAYVYIFDITEGLENAMMIFPNDLEKDNKLKAKKEVLIPNPKKAKFIVPEPGKQKVIIIASTKKIEIQEKEQKGAFFFVSKEFVKNIRVVEPGDEKDGVELVFDVR